MHRFVLSLRFATSYSQFNIFLVELSLAIISAIEILISLKLPINIAFKIINSFDSRSQTHLNRIGFLVLLKIFIQ
jgi:hypothetical protein